VPVAPNRFRHALVFGVAGALAAIGISVFLGVLIGNGRLALPAFAGVSAAVSAAVLWPRFFRNRPPTFFRGAIAGLQIVLLAYPLTWCLMFLGTMFWPFGAPTPDSGIPAWTAIPATFIYSVWGIVFTGWISLPIGAVAGGLLALWDCRAHTPA
jgi:hypothetical protein